MFVCCLASCLFVLGSFVCCVGLLFVSCLIVLLVVFVNSVVIVILLMFSLD